MGIVSHIFDSMSKPTSPTIRTLPIFLVINAQLSLKNIIFMMNIVNIASFPLKRRRVIVIILALSGATLIFQMTPRVALGIGRF